MLSFFPRGVLDEILNLIESVSEAFPSYSLNAKDGQCTSQSRVCNGKYPTFQRKLILTEIIL